MVACYVALLTVTFAPKGPAQLFGRPCAAANIFALFLLVGSFLLLLRHGLVSKWWGILLAHGLVAPLSILFDDTEDQIQSFLGASWISTSTSVLACMKSESRKGQAEIKRFEVSVSFQSFSLLEKRLR